MTDDRNDPADTFASHDAFERREGAGEGGTYELTTTVFETAVRPQEGDVEITVTVPALPAAVEGETVADVVADGWFETFERRLEDVYRVASIEGEGPTVERDVREIQVRLAYDSPRPAADAKALIEYVEGTYAQGLIPGYEYGGPAGELLAAAREHGEQGPTTGEGSGPPI